MNPPKYMSEPATTPNVGMNVSYWVRLRHKFLVLIGKHVWGVPVDISPTLWKRTGLVARRYHIKCQNCDMERTVDCIGH